MKRGLWIAVGMVLLTTVTCSMGPSQEQELSATVVEIVNQVDAHARPNDEWRPAELQMAVYAGGQVRTGLASSARLGLLEGVVRLWAESIFTVTESAARQDKLVTRLFLQQGRLWAHLTTEQPHEFSVETASAVAAVRDTRFSVAVAPDQTTLVSVAEGQAEVTAQGGRVLVNAGEQTLVKPGQPPAPPEPMSAEERAMWATEGDMPELAPPAPTSTATAVPATATLLPTETPAPTATDTPAPTDTPPPTHTPTALPTDTPTLTPLPPTATPEPTAASGPPTILSVDFPSQLATDGVPVKGHVAFVDPDGDVNWASFDVISAVSFDPFGFNPAEFLAEGDTRQGVFGFNTWCTIAQDVTLRVTLTDGAGNSSAPVDFSFSCR